MDIMKDALRNRRGKNFEITIAVKPSEEDTKSGHAPPPAEQEASPEDNEMPPHNESDPNAEMMEALKGMAEPEAMPPEGMHKMSLGQRARTMAHHKMKGMQK